MRQASLQQQVNTLSTAKQGLLERSRDVHSAFRGIAGAAGALFLTYGALIPLTTAFFASTAIKRAITEFTDLEFQLKFVQAAADDYSVSVQDMSQQLTKMAVDAGKMPVEASKGLRLLAQSGLSATESLQALPSIMRTATIGELDMADAATTMTGAMFAFNLGVGDLERIGDVFAKAGSMSNTSVAQISESMKQASSIAQEYKLSIEDVSTVLVALAKRNITGSAAGTAVRNLYGDLAAPRGAGKDVAKALGISLFGKDGKIKDLFSEYIPEIRKALDKLTHESQVLVLNRIANERGGKALSALLGMSDKDLGDVRAQLQKAPGFVRGAVDTLNDTLQRDFDRLKSTLSSSLIQGGEAGALGIRSAVQELTKLVASPEFVGAVSNLVKLTAALAQGFVWLGQVIMSPVAQFSAVAASAGMMTGAFSSAVPVMTAAAGALGLTAGAARVAGTALATLTRAFAWFAGISVAVGLLSMLYDKLSEKTPYDEAVSNLDRIIKRQKDYSKELDDTLRKLREQKGLSVAPLSDRAQLAKDRQNLRAIADQDKRVLEEMLKNPLMKSGWAAQRRKADASEAAYQNLAGRSLNMYYKDQEDAKKAEEIARLSAPRSAFIQGTDGETPRDLKLPDSAADAAARKAQSEASKLYQNALRPSQTMKAEFDNANRALDTQAKLDEARLQGTYDKGLVSYEDFESARDKLQKGARDARIASLDREAADTQSEIEKIRAAAAAANAQAPGAVTAEQLESDVSRLQNQIAAGKQEVVQLRADQEQADISSSTRRAKGLVDATKSAQDLLLVSKLDAENQAEASRFRQEILLMSEVGAVRAQAEREVTEKFLKEELRLRAEIEKYKDADPAVADKARGELQNLRGKDPKDLAVQAGERAVQEFRATKIAETARELKSGLADAFLEGGESGAEMLRNTLQDVFIKKPLKLMLEAAFNPFAEAASSGITSFLGNVLGLRAGGGPVSAGNRYLVGENGPEVVEFGQAGRVYNTNESRQMLSSPQQGGQSVHITVAPQISIDSRSDRGQVQQLVAAGVKEGNKQMVEQLKTLGVVR